jgi:hypothetical protein
MKILQNEDTPPCNSLEGLCVRSETLLLLITPLGHLSGLDLSSTRRANRSSADGSYQWSKNGFC